MWLVSSFATVRRYSVRWLIFLMAMGALLLAGCDSDDDTCDITDARVAQANSVFRVFTAQEGENCFLFEGGLFGPSGVSSSPTRLCFTDVQAEMQPPTSRFMTDPDDASEPGAEGEADGSDSCNYLYDGAPNTIPCPVCDIVVNATNISPGKQGRGTVKLHLDGPPGNIDEPRFRSATVQVTVGTDAQCNVTSINDVAVVQEPN